MTDAKQCCFEGLLPTINTDVLPTIYTDVDFSRLRWLHVQANTFELVWGYLISRGGYTGWDLEDGFSEEAENGIDKTISFTGEIWSEKSFLGRQMRGFFVYCCFTCWKTTWIVQLTFSRPFFFSEALSRCLLEPYVFIFNCYFILNYFCFLLTRKNFRRECCLILCRCWGLDCQGWRDITSLWHEGSYIY